MVMWHVLIQPSAPLPLLSVFMTDEVKLQLHKRTKTQRQQWANVFVWPTTEMNVVK